MSKYITKYNISGLRVHHSNIIRQHLNQNYGELECEFLFDKIRQRYRLFPHEALYVIDCKHVQFEPLLGDFNQITGHQGSHQNDISVLYTHVGDCNYPALIRWVETMLDGMFGQWDELEPEQDVVSCVYLSKDNRVILKSTTPLVFDSHGVMRYSLGKLTDLTGIIPFQHFSYRFQGPNQTSVLETYHDMMKSVNVLSARETEILQMVGCGDSSDQIAKKLFISKLTVDKHRRNIIEKIGATSAREAFIKCKNEAFF